MVVFLKLSHQFEKEKLYISEVFESRKKTLDTMNFREQLLHIPLYLIPGVAGAVSKTSL